MFSTIGLAAISFTSEMQRCGARTVMILIEFAVPHASNAVYVTMQTPAETPVSKPDDGEIVAMLTLLLVQIPPGVVFVSVVDRPGHKLNTPAIGATVPELADTLTTLVPLHPDESSYVMIAVPTEIPVTSPDETLTVATAALLLVQTPPPDVQLKCKVVPTHVVFEPAIASEPTLTVTVFVEEQPEIV
jgi:hypothetical protein